MNYGESKAGEIYAAIASMVADTDAISKERTNDQQKYKFRGIDDVYNMVHPLFAKYGVFTVPTVLEERTEERATKSGSALIYRVLKISYDFFARDGSSVKAIVMGEGMDSGDKASNKAMAVAHKYAIMQILSIPTDDLKDPENDSHDLRPKRELPPEDAGLQDVRNSRGEYSWPADPGPLAPKGDGTRAAMLKLQTRLNDIAVAKYPGTHERVLTADDIKDMNAEKHPGGRNLEPSPADLALLESIVEKWQAHVDSAIDIYQNGDSAGIDA